MDNNSHVETRDLEELRRILLAPEIARLDQLADRLDDPERFSSEISEVLPQAMQKSAQQGEQLSNAMVPTVEDIVRLSIKRDINKFADALFPVIGPAIRKSISETLRQMLQTLNQSLENSFSFQGVKWRVESIRTGIPFSSIVMLHSLAYRVEQVFLIHRQTGLMLNHVSMEDSDIQDADMVSSMLTAIRDFVGDSFDVDKHQSLNSVQVGDVSIWIEQAPDIILAFAIRGDAPNKLRIEMHQVLEDIQSRYGKALSDFSGDTTTFLPTRELLLKSLQSQYREPVEKKYSLKTRLFILLLIIIFAYWLVSGMYLSRQQDRYVQTLENEPGYVITGVVKNGKKIRIKGLRDPLSREPEVLIKTSELKQKDVSYQFEYFLSLQKEFVNKRILESIKRPATVSVVFEDDVLKLSGSADNNWIHNFETTVNNKGSIAFDLSRLVNTDEESLTADIKALEEINIFFDIATSHNEEANNLLREIAGLTENIIKTARSLSREAKIVIEGHSDSDGSYQDNILLSQERANYVARYCVDNGISIENLLIKGLGAPITKESTDADRRYNRRVTFKVIINKAE